MNEVFNHKRTAVSARAPQWADQSHSAIILMVVFEELMEYGEIPFSATPEDSEPHGVDLFNRAVAGEFGEVKEPTFEMVLAQVMCRRVDMSGMATAKINSLVADVETLQDSIQLDLATDDQVQSLPSVQAELDAWRLYRVQLAQLDVQPGYPLAFDWPISPAQPFEYVAPEIPQEILPVHGVSKAELPET